MARALTMQAAGGDLHLQVGEALQIQFMDDETRGQFYVRVIGFLPERSVIVTTPEKGGQPMHVREGRGLLVRSFNSDQAHGFSSIVLRSCVQPYAYLHLTFPKKIETMAERQAARVRSALAMSVHLLSGGSAEQGVPGVIRDISNTGAQILAAGPIGKSGDRVLIRTRLPLDVLGDQPVDLPSLIRNVQEESDIKGSLWRFRSGVEFEPLDTQSTLVLRAYLYERFAAPR